MVTQVFRNLGGPFPSPKFGGPKTSTFWRNFAQLCDLIANISRTQQDIINRKMALQTTDTTAQANLIRAVRCVITQTRPLCFAAVSFFFLFSARSARSLSWSLRNFATWSEMGAILKTRSKIWGSSPQKMEAEKLAFFRGDFGRLHISIANISGTE